MNVNEFAEQVVFGTSLAEKLTRPGHLDFSIAGPKTLSMRTAKIACPGRPVGLEMNRHHVSAKPPSAHELDSELERGRLLHFLANHELLATELMALVLLRFPEAPVEFRKGVAGTLFEEQRHTKMYLARMEQCGVGFGSYPLSGLFWRMVEPMECPLDFVSTLSLTFEQANLDYSLHYSKLFAEIGDRATSQLLFQIYQDEIDHVRHGLKWFREWKSPHQGEFEAWSERLTFPMSPERARGSGAFFNRTGREAAGLTSSFIEAVQVYRMSRGRTPDVHWFDAGAEAEFSPRDNVRERSLLDQLNRDLEWLPIFLAKPDDVVLVRELPSTSCRQQWLQADIQLPEFVSFDRVGVLRERKLHRLHPWAWTPESHRFAKQFADRCRVQPCEWQEHQRDLYRKSFAASILSNGFHNLELAQAEVAPAESHGVFVESTSELEANIRRLAELGYDSAILKSDFGTAGRGQRRIATQGVTAADRAWIQSLLAMGQGGVVEPELERVLDLSFLWDWDAESPQPKFLGWTRFAVSKGHRYQGTYLGRFLGDQDQELSRFLLADDCARLHAIRRWLEAELVPAFNARAFRHSFGVDIWVDRSPGGQLRLKPLGELNPRMTMGHVARRIEKRLAPGARGFFSILTKSEYDQLDERSRSPSVVAGRDGRWQSANLVLSAHTATTRLVPRIQVGEA